MNKPRTLFGKRGSACCALALGGVLGLAVSAQAALGANNWGPAPAQPGAQPPAQAPARASPVYIDTPKSGATLWGTGGNGGAVYAPEDLDARLSGAGAQQLPPLQTPRPALAVPAQGHATPAPYGARAPYATAPAYGGTPYSGLPYGAVPYGGARGQYPYNNSGWGPLGSGLPAGGFPFFGFSPFGFW